MFGKKSGGQMTGKTSKLGLALLSFNSALLSLNSAFAVTQFCEPQ